jgi:alpha-tubulin suppressor-like RCC1 family protein
MIITPIEVPELEGGSGLFVGASSSCAIRPDGRVVCWGDNSAGQLGY